MIEIISPHMVKSPNVKFTIMLTVLVTFISNTSYRCPWKQTETN